MGSPTYTVISGLNLFTLAHFGLLARLPTLKRSCYLLRSKANYGRLAKPYPTGFAPAMQHDLARPHLIYTERTPEGLLYIRRFHWIFAV